ncbi:uncharacterized protein LOC110852424 [Folsomia candida]|uniref:Lipocalin/cytosolic fatty-acid binding domain-containing protein n=1 Tax=Folsomia candida TaxID=158441 RepID=A0A226E385_FOLCA|nr:uncharacterized protein LOC110852424 [Folsomia candida]OXA51899.1 hypothetical protein Fcan01_13378 [Folsomia candida]
MVSHLATLFGCAFLACSALAACPVFIPVGNLDLVEYSGDWKIHGLLRTFGGNPGMRCLHVEMDSLDWTTEPVDVHAILHGEYVATNVTFEQELPAEVPRLIEPGKWTININGTNFEHTILHTDYNNSLVISCAPVTDFDNALIVLFNTRTFEPMNPTVIDQYKYLLQNYYQIDDEFYYPIFQSEEFCKEHTHP